MNLDTANYQALLAEVEKLRARVVELEAELHMANTRCDLARRTLNRAVKITTMKPRQVEADE